MLIPREAWYWRWHGGNESDGKRSRWMDDLLSRVFAGAYGNAQAWNDNEAMERRICEACRLTASIFFSVAFQKPFRHLGACMFMIWWLNE